VLRAATEFRRSCHNEEGNLRPLIAAIRESVEPLKISYEIVLTDDRSTDGTWQLLNEFAAADRAFVRCASRVTPANPPPCGPG
jgi:glycosyltransferase involved in cell wall biosynthesis